MSNALGLHVVWLITALCVWIKSVLPHSLSTPRHINDHQQISLSLSLIILCHANTYYINGQNS